MLLLLLTLHDLIRERANDSASAAAAGRARLAAQTRAIAGKARQLRSGEAAVRLQAGVGRRCTKMMWWHSSLLFQNNYSTGIAINGQFHIVGYAIPSILRQVNKRYATLTCDLSRML